MTDRQTDNKISLTQDIIVQNTQQKLTREGLLKPSAGISNRGPDRAESPQARAPSKGIATDRKDNVESGTHKALQKLSRKLRLSAGMAN